MELFNRFADADIEIEAGQTPRQAWEAMEEHEEWDHFIENCWIKQNFF